MDRLISEWLAKAHPVPKQARAEWANQGVALLPLGQRFAAVRLSGALVHAALNSDEPRVVAETLSERLRGPVIHDNRTTGPTYYALIQWHAGLVWNYNRSAPCLRDDTYLGVPRIDRREPPGTYWVVPPSYEGNLCRPQAVRELVDAGHRQLIQQTLV
ncbi:hypothetical protein [Streptomyces fulvoviolaceus]|uniref:hypothetical protein n=1 Tax=Streptomyces fulvoviolaceus TaxID=285535 RepID=UPI0021BEE4DB|nr:hypothetical protein [Streptomyces fulvoviolaceus]MCT9081451.1 hypothetical protein [Streptomyces fulvoviolaceus]